jgi:uracil-DNA glycosylase
MESLESIAVDVRRCTECNLCESRAQAVPGEGPQDAQVVFIGEAPGAQEDEFGRPFVGRAGGLLDKMLDTIDLKREDVFITNVVKCRPPDNRSPHKSEIAACRPFLDQQLAAIQPKLIVTLGRFATSQFVSGRISDLHGQPQRVDGLLVYPVFHPAAALRRTSWKQALEEDFQRLPDLMEAERMNPDNFSNNSQSQTPDSDEVELEKSEEPDLFDPDGLEGEEWRPVPGYEGYDASSFGRVRSYYARGSGPDGSQGRWHIAKEPQRILRPSQQKRGYRIVQVQKDEKTAVKRVGELVALAFLGPKPEGMVLCRIDGVPSNSRLDNLRYAPPDEIVRNVPCGEDHYLSKLTDEDVLDARRRRAAGERISTLAAEYGVTETTIASVCRGESWKHVGGPITKRQSPLTDQDVRDIRKMYSAGGVTLMELEEQFGVSVSYLSRLVRGKYRRDAGGPIVAGRGRETEGGEIP